MLQKHILAQSLDIVLHLIEFRLNQKHLVQADMNRRSNRSKGKIKVYNAMLKEIQLIYPNFNIGITTGKRDSVLNYWNDPYRHWIFESTTS